jgi:hypothetical protein
VIRRGERRRAWAEVEEVNKEPKSKREIEEMVSAALTPDHPHLWRVGLIHGVSGWTCHVSRLDAPLGPVSDANAELAKLLGHYVIVDEDGRELDGRLRKGK